MELRLGDAFPGKYLFMQDILDDTNEYKYHCLINPRSSAKSKSIGKLAFLCSMLRKGDVLAVRKNNNTLKTSVIQELIDCIDEYELHNYFEYHKTEQWIRYIPNGNTIYFRGIDKGNIKGLKPRTKWQMLWIDEVQQLVDESEIEVIIQTVVKNAYPHFVYFESGNGDHRPSHWVNKRVAKIKNNKYYKYVFQTYKDIEHLLPPELLHQIQITKETSYEIYALDYLGELGQGVRSVYKKFKREDVVVSSIDKSAINVIVGGADYGDSDATTFKASFFSKKFDRVQVAPGYYHKNGVSPGLKDINDYAKDFFIYYKNIYETYGKRILVNVDSAALAFIKVLQKIQKQNNYHWLVIKGTNKAKKVSKYGAIESRIVVTNLLLGAGRLEIHEDNEDLLQAFEMAEYNDNGERIDNGSSNIDSLDGFEYTLLEFIEQIYNSIFLIKGE